MITIASSFARRRNCINSSVEFGLFARKRKAKQGCVDRSLVYCCFIESIKLASIVENVLPIRFPLAAH